MPNKTVTINEPTADDLQAITMILRNGQIVGIEVALEVTSAEPRARYRPNTASLKSRVNTYSRAVREGLALLPAEAVSKFTTSEGF